MSDRGPGDADVTLLVSCVGRRVELLQAFRAAARRLRIALKLVGTDTTATAPALGCVDVAELLPPIADAAYVPALLAAAQRHGARALLPTIDTDLPAIAAARDRFDALGCTALIAEPAVIRLCRDKIETFRFLRSHGIDTPETYLPAEIRALARLQFPYFLKPRYGSASLWTHKIEDSLDLEYHLQRVSDAIVQEFVDGVEHTLDVYVGLSGSPRCVVPRMRWAVRGGEVSKGVVVKDAAIMDAGRQVVEALGPSVRGLVTLQCIVTSQRRIRFIEVNPRFGGGAPLGIAAGADYAGWLLTELTGGVPQIAFDGFTHGLCMLRYDWSSFVQLDGDLQPRLAPPTRRFPEFE
jgi:carbamoyl-phosphate synthase large subunit